MISSKLYAVCQYRLQNERPALNFMQFFFFQMPAAKQTIKINFMRVFSTGRKWERSAVNFMQFFSTGHKTDNPK